MVDAVAINSTTIRLEWQLHISNTNDYVEGLYVRYRNLSAGADAQSYSMLTIPMNPSETYVITGLEKFTRYEFFLTPYFKTVEGQPTSSKVVQTLEDFPTGAPMNVQTGMVNLTTGLVNWLPPVDSHLNGVLLGYKVQLRAANSSKVLAQITLNATTTSIVFHSLTTGQTYTVRVVAFNRVGAGPYSKPAYLVMDPAHVIAPPRAHNSLSDFEDTRKLNMWHEPWFTVPVVVLLMMLLVSGVLTVVLIVRNRAKVNKEMMSATTTVSGSAGGGMTDPSRRPMVVSRRDCLWIDRGWRSTDTDKDSGLSEAKLLESSQNTANYADVSTDYAEVDPRSITSFYNSRKVSFLWDPSDIQRSRLWPILSIHFSNYFSFLGFTVSRQSIALRDHCTCERELQRQWQDELPGPGRVHIRSVHQSFRSGNVSCWTSESFHAGAIQSR